MSDSATLAQAAARIAELEGQVTELQKAIGDITAHSEALRQELIATKGPLAEVAKTKARLAELEALTADPPATGKVVKVTRFMTSDGHKWKFLPDAIKHEATLSLASTLDLTLDAASGILDKRDLVRRHFDLAEGRE